MLLVVDGVRGLRTQYAANGWVIFGRRLRHTVCISCWLLQTSKVPSSLCIWHKTRLLTKAGAYRGGVVLIVDRCLAVAMTVPEGIGHHPTVGEPAMQWVDFLTFRGQEKSPDSCESGLFIWCRRDESNTRPSHYEFSPAVQSELYRSSDERKSLSPLKFPHSAVEAVATQPPAKRAISVPELCHADRRAEPAKSRGPPVLPATRDKAQHSCFACFGAVERDYRLISPRQIFRPLAH